MASNCARPPSISSTGGKGSNCQMCAVREHGRLQGHLPHYPLIFPIGRNSAPPHSCLFFLTPLPSAQSVIGFCRGWKGWARRCAPRRGLIVGKPDTLPLCRSATLLERRSGQQYRCSSRQSSTHVGATGDAHPSPPALLPFLSLNISDRP